MPDALGRLVRDEALLLVGLLVADADGKRLPVEVEALLDALERRHARVDERGRHLVQVLAAQVRDRGLPSLLAQVQRSLPTDEDRRWAFGLAIEVAYSDGSLHLHEAEDIADLGHALGLARDDVQVLVRRR